MLVRNTSAGRTAGLSCFEFLTAGDTSADFLDNLPKRGTHGDFNQAGVVDLAAQGKYFGALGLFGTHGSKPFRAV